MTASRISDVAGSSGLSAATLRYYEAVGLLRTDRATNGYRHYRPEDIDRLRFVARAKRLGLRLNQIAELAALRDGGRCAPARERISAPLADKLVQIRRSIREHAACEHELDQFIRQLEARPAPQRCGAECGCPDHPLQLEQAPLVACTLAAEEAGSRVREWRGLAATAVVSRPVAHGWQLRVVGNPGRAGRIAGLAVAEQRCCPFLRVRLDLRHDTIERTVTAPLEAGPVVRHCSHPWPSNRRRAETHVGADLRHRGADVRRGHVCTKRKGVDFDGWNNRDREALGAG